MSISRRFTQAFSTCVVAAAVGFAALSVPASVRADDTEVFFPRQDVTQLGLINPNVMFVIDTSGSMSEKDGFTQTRLQRVQEAFVNIMQDINPNVNVGLMRYSGILGGAVMFPVSPVDAYVDEVDKTAGGNRAMQAQIADTASEVYQTGSTNTVTLAANTLKLDGATVTTSAGVRTLGIRFDNVQVPQGVNIAKANVLLHTDTGTSTSGSMTIKIEVESADNAAVYTTTANTVNTGRTYEATPSVTWTIASGASTAFGSELETPDLAGLLNKAISRAGWCGGNAVNLRLTMTSASSTSVVRTFVGSTQSANAVLAPLLNLEFATNDPKLQTGCNKAKFSSQIGAVKTDDSYQEISGGANFPACNVVYLNTSPSAAASTVCGTRNRPTQAALRFANLNIPKGATVLSAFLDFTPYATDTVTPALTIVAENSANPATYSSSGSHVSGRISSPGTTGSVTWNTTAWASTTAVYSSPDLKAMVQTIVNRSDWDPTSNALSFFITGGGTSGQQKAAVSSDYSLANAPRLRIQIQGPAGRLKVRQYLQELVMSFNAYGGTPTMPAYYEAARYMRGEAAFYGRSRSYGFTYSSGVKVNYPGSSGSGIQVDATSANYAAASRVSSRAAWDYTKGTPNHSYPAGCTDFNLNAAVCTGESWTGTAVYKSPVTDSCQSNNIILLSDGLPNVTTSKSPTTPTSSAVDLITGLSGFTGGCAAVKDSKGANQPEWICGNELAKFLYTKDQIPDTVFKGSQLIKTYTIAFGPDFNSGSADAVGRDFLNGIAKNGGTNEGYTANSADEVVNVFRQIIAQILDQGTTFVAPSVTVNTFNRLTNRNELYFALFQPSATVNWPGNLKRYQILQKDGGSTPQIYDKSGNLAVDQDSGFFRKEACSYWTADCNDGSTVGKGGAASRLTNTRKIYSNLTGTSNVDLTVSANTVVETNAEVTKTLLGNAAMTDADRTEVIKWARGIDVDDEDGDTSFTDARLTLGDPLHSKPTLISYGGTNADPDLTIFYGDNQGYLHAVEASTGNEHFAFIPKDLLGNLNVYYQGGGNHENRPYGMDGPIATYVTDSKKLLYAGMRRGGRNYYALDVTTRTSPKLAFQITGGGSGSFKELGQSWSPPVLAKIRLNGTDYGKGGTPPVLIFGGGYDPSQDTKTNLFSGSTRSGDSQGRAIFIVNADTGALLWWAGYKDTGTNPNLSMPDMLYSVPSSPAVIDVNGDGMVDRIYFADTGGQVFRIALEKDAGGLPSLTKAKGALIASLATAGEPTSRRFFNTPDIALVTEGVTSPFLAISVGTGHRERPLDTTNEDRFYVLKDPSINIDPIADMYINGDADLYDATANLAGSATAATALQAKKDIAAKKGLYIKLGASEKVLTESTTFANQVIFASFEPPGQSTADSICQAKAGTSRFYQINIADATPVKDFNDNGTLTKEDRAKVLPVSGLPPDPVILFPSIRVAKEDNGSTTVCNGADCAADKGQLVSPMVFVGPIGFSMSDVRQTKKAYWRKVE